MRPNIVSVSVGAGREVVCQVISYLFVDHLAVGVVLACLDLGLQIEHQFIHQGGVMKLIVFGATGSVGRHVVAQALESGHDVTAFVRDPAKLTTKHPRLTVVRGDATDLDAVTNAVEGHDAVMVTLGAGRKGGIRAAGTAATIQAMERTGVRRLICQSTIGVGDSRANLTFYWKYLMFGLLLRPAYADHVQQEAHVERSALDWTIVRPAAFTDGPHTGDYRRGFAGNDRTTTLKIARADVADFLLEQLTDDSYLHRTPAISY